MTELTPELEALYALHRNVPRGELSMAAQLEYDRLRAAWEQGEARPAAGELEAARLAWEHEYSARHDSGPAIRHAVDRSGTTRTFRYRRVFHMVLGIPVVVIGVGVLVGDAAGLAYPLSSWARGDGGVSTWDSIWMAAVGLLVTWLGIRPESVAAAPAAEAVQIRCLECGAESADATQVCARCGAPAVGPRSVATGLAVARPSDGLRAAAAGDAGSPPAWIRRGQPYYMICLIFFLALYMTGWFLFERTQGSGLHHPMEWGIDLGVVGALLSVVLFEAARRSPAISSGVSDGIRTRDIQDHNLALCQLSYAHHRHPAYGSATAERALPRRTSRG